MANMDKNETINVLEAIYAELKGIREALEKRNELPDHSQTKKQDSHYVKQADMEPNPILIEYIREVMGAGNRMERTVFYNRICEMCREGKQPIPTKNMLYLITRNIGYGEIRSSGARYFVS